MQFSFEKIERDFPAEYGALLDPSMSRLITYWALFVGQSSRLVEHRAIFVKYKALLEEHRTLMEKQNRLPVHLNPYKELRLFL